MYASSVNPYQSQAVTTAGPAQLVLMLYDGVLAAVARAGQAMVGGGAVEAANHELLRAQRIVTELRVTLDHERGGALAGSLASLYDFCLERLVAANVGKDRAALEDAASVIQQLRDAWEQACCGAPAAAGAAR